MPSQLPNEAYHDWRSGCFPPASRRQTTVRMDMLGEHLPSASRRPLQTVVNCAANEATEHLNLASPPKVWRNVGNKKQTYVTTEKA